MSRAGPRARGVRRRFVGASPIGLGHTKPNHYVDMLKVAVENRDQLAYAWRILNDGCCDGCALGTAGMRDWTISGIHLCSVRLKLLRLNTMPAADARLLEHSAALRHRSARDLRAMGRLPYPMVWRRGDPGFRRVSWEEALEVCAERMRGAARRDPDRVYFYLTSRGIPNETYFAFQKVARFLGTNNIDNSARLCHAPSTTGLGATIGYGATTCSYADWIGTDLLVLAGTNLANNQPVAMKYIDEAKKRGTRVAVVNPYREEGLSRYWVPSSWDSALWGTRVMDDFFEVTNGGDAAFFTGALKHLVETRRVDEAFIGRYTAGFEDLRGYVDGLSWDALERGRVRRRRKSGGSPASTPARTRRSRSGRWASPSMRTASRTSLRSATSRSRWGGSAGRTPASTRSAATPASRAAQRSVRSRIATDRIERSGIPRQWRRCDGCGASTCRGRRA